MRVETYLRGGLLAIHVEGKLLARFIAGGFGGLRSRDTFREGVVVTNDYVGVGPTRYNSFVLCADENKVTIQRRSDANKNPK